MRKLFLFATFLPGILGVLQSCSKKSISEPAAPISSSVINANIAPNGIYQLSIENTGNPGISRQASHFKVSQTEPDSKSGFTVYKYIPAVDYRGTDEVVLSRTKTILAPVNSSGFSGNHTSNPDNSTTTVTSYITVRINITD